MTGQGGWPMTVFLDPGRDARSSAAPTSRRRPARHARVRRAVLQGARRGLAEPTATSSPTVAGRFTARARRRAPGRRSGGTSRARIVTRAARDRAAVAVRPRVGGFGGAPKFPPAMALDFLLRRTTSPDGRPRAARHGPYHPRRDGRRRDLRPARRRVPPLLASTTTGSSRTSRRCSTTRRSSCATYTPGVPGHRRARYRRIVEETHRLRAARPPHPRRRLLLRRGRRLRGDRRQVLRLERRRAPRRSRRRCAGGHRLLRSNAPGELRRWQHSPRRRPHSAPTHRGRTVAPPST